MSASASQLGATVTNIATVSFGDANAPQTVSTPPAIFKIEARRTPSTIEFFRFAPTAPDAVATNINGSRYATSQNADGSFEFADVRPPVLPGGALINTSAPVPLISAEHYFAGDVAFVSVTDAGQNGDPSAIETVIATITSDVGDQITLLLFETGPNTGVFFGYFTTTSAPSPITDDLLRIGDATQLTAVYQDPYDLAEVSTDTAGVDPYGRIFDSTTGALIDGAIVTIVDDATGQPAQVFGVDGFSAYPSTLISGGTVTDASGFTYNLDPGEFVFPIMFPGTYRLVITPPAGYSAPSAASPADIAALPGGPYTIADASYLLSFVVDGSGDVSFDVPLDPGGEVTVTKTAGVAVAAPGDFVRYEILAENSSASNAIVAIRDTLPKGFRYQAGSARRDGARVDDPVIASDGRTLSFSGGALGAGETARFTYVAEVTGGAVIGDAVNSAVAIDGAGREISNTALASIRIREDLLRSRLTIVGRVAANACNPDDGWPRKISEGEGVENIRLYMETGAYVVTDEDGLFTFQDVEPKTHVVQVDTASLPEGYEPVICEANSRYAGSAISKFVDAQGGTVWRANFYLKKTKNAEAAQNGPQSTAEIENDATDYKAYDKAWLARQNPEPAIAYPADGETPSRRSVNFGVKHAADQSAALYLNGEKVPAANYAGRDVGITRRAAITRWRGVDLVEGRNEFEAVVNNPDGGEVVRITRVINYVSAASRAVLDLQESILFADGQTAPEIAVKITDAAGRPVQAGQMIKVTIDPPYRALSYRRTEDRFPITAPTSTEATATVGAGGVARVKLEPTLRSGKARIVVALDDQRKEEFSVYLAPQLREWIVVGLAEGAARRETVQTGDAPSARDLMGDGRIAFFAKGAVKGEWLITVAADTDKSRGDEDDRLFDIIDPNAQYMIYGDRSRQEFEAQSRYPVFFKAEKNAFQALVGDFDTGLSETTLGRYDRRLTGFRSVYQGDRFSFTGFAAETNQSFIRDELPADGTSGPFRISAAPIVLNSEQIFIERRNRFRPDIVLSRTPLARFLDYDLDPDTGEFIFRLPIAAADDVESFNVIVVEYETSAPTQRSLIAGGRAAVRLPGNLGEAGATVIHEGETRDADAAPATLASVDLRVDISDTTRAQFEMGRTYRNDAGTENPDAVLIEVEHQSERVSARAYYNRVEADYGFAQQGSGLVGARRYGGEVSVLMHEFHDERTGRRGARYAEAKFYDEENLATGASRRVMEAALRQESDKTSGSLGVRRVVETPATGAKRKSTLLTSDVSHSFEKVGLTVRGGRDQAISSSDGSTLFPTRTRVGFDQKISDDVTLSVTHEIQSGDNVNSANTIVGVVAEPWTGGRVSGGVDRLTQDSGRRLGATVGVDQQVRISDKWSASFGVSRREELTSDGDISIEDDILPDTPLSPLEAVGDFTSLYVGAGYRTNLMNASARLETRQSNLGDRYTAIFGGAREISEALSFAGAARLQQNDNADAADETRIDVTLGTAWRPRDNGTLLFSRLDMKQFDIEGDSESWKVIHNLALNTMLMENWQLSINHGVKYSVFDDLISRQAGVTQLAGVETRYDINSWLDVGFRGSALYSHNSDTIDYSYGPSLGVNPADNFWISIGYNIDGFYDEDFIGAEFTRKGPYIQLRLKFDQNTADGLLNLISLDP